MLDNDRVSVYNCWTMIDRGSTGPKKVVATFSRRETVSYSDLINYDNRLRNLTTSMSLTILLLLKVCKYINNNK